MRAMERNAEQKKPDRKTWALLRRRDSAELNCSDSLPAERSARAATRRVKGRDRQNRTQRDGKVSDSIGPRSEGGQFRKRSAVTTVRAHEVPAGAHELFGLARQFAAVGTQRIVRAVCEAGREAKWSGCNAGESVIERGPNSA